MHTQTLVTAYGCLLHDIGKVVYRAGAVSGDHSTAGASWLRQRLTGDHAKAVLDCLRYHHGRAIRSAKLPPNSPAYITYLADNIAAAADRRAQDTVDNFGFDRSQPLAPVFLHLNGEHPGRFLAPLPMDGVLHQPVSNMKLTQGDYQCLLNGLAAGLDGVTIGEAWLNSLLCLMETFTSTIPGSTSRTESPDISLFDHLKITAAAGSCISEWLMDNGVSDYRQALLKGEKSFCKQPVFLLYSADFSGIQKFIYTVSTKNALRSLRSRSFFLELAMEHYIDELLTVCGVSRANLLYSGGGHCYILLPNTESVKNALVNWNTRFNDWLAEQFGVSLYLANGWTECTANDLTNRTDEGGDYSAMFRRVSTAIAKQKLHRYTSSQIKRMNLPKFDSEGRECRICGRTDTLTRDRDGETEVCRWCNLFEEISIQIQEKSVYIVTKTQENKGFVLPTADGMAAFAFEDEKKARSLLKENAPVIRIYTKNSPCTGLNYATYIYVGDYHAGNDMEELAKASEGIARLGVCRMDVDDLGQSFVSGFPKQYSTISRTAAFSRQLSLFFKCYINGILDGLIVTIVYSGGDDVFLVGAWNDVIEASIRIRTQLREFTCESLTISGGVALFDHHHPIRLAANQTAELEAQSKSLPKKDGFTLFEANDEKQYCYPWDEFISSVMGEKLDVLTEFFKKDEENNKKNDRGNSFLYRLTDLLRGTGKGKKINLARYAYTLARLEPKEQEKKAVYQKFSKKMYGWAGSKDDRKQLITAIYIHVYRNRKRKEL